MMDVEKVGKHRLSCESIEEANFDKLMAGRKAHILYTDPPWKNPKYWTTLTKKQTGEEYEPLTYREILEELKKVIKKHVDGYIFIEASVNTDLDEFKEIFKNQIYNLEIHRTKYRTGGKERQALLISGGTSPEYNPDIEVEGLSGMKLLHEVFKETSKPGEIALDPYCGKGMTARAALKRNMLFYGNEFNRKRLNETKEALR